MILKDRDVLDTFCIFVVVVMGENREKSLNNDDTVLSLDCTSSARDIFISKIRGGQATILRRFILFEDVTRFKGRVNLVKRGDMDVELDYKFSFQIRFKTLVNGQIFIGLMSGDNFNTHEIEDLSCVNIRWINSGVIKSPTGHFHQQCDSLIKSTKCRNLLSDCILEFDRECCNTFGHRFGWIVDPVIEENKNDSRPTTRTDRRLQKKADALNYAHVEVFE